MFVAGLSRKGGMKRLGGSGGGEWRGGGSDGRGYESETRVDNDYLVSQVGRTQKRSVSQN